MADLLASWWPYVAALLPTIGLAYLFWVVMKHIVEADRRERFAQREWDRTHSVDDSRDQGPESTPS